MSWLTADEKLFFQAQKAVYRYQKLFGFFNAKQNFQLFDATVKPILCYGSQVWGTTYSPEIEYVHISFCKKYLGVKDKTNNSIVLGECGRLPLCITYFTNCINYWCIGLQMPDNRLPNHCSYMLKYLDNVGKILGHHKLRTCYSFTFQFCIDFTNRR